MKQAVPQPLIDLLNDSTYLVQCWGLKYDGLAWKVAFPEQNISWSKFYDLRRNRPPNVDSDPRTAQRVYFNTSVIDLAQHGSDLFRPLRKRQTRVDTPEGTTFTYDHDADEEFHHTMRDASNRTLPWPLMEAIASRISDHPIDETITAEAFLLPKEILTEGARLRVDVSANCLLDASGSCKEQFYETLWKGYQAWREASPWSAKSCIYAMTIASTEPKRPHHAAEIPQLLNIMEEFGFCASTLASAFSITFPGMSRRIYPDCLLEAADWTGREAATTADFAGRVVKATLRTKGRKEEPPVVSGPPVA